MSARRALAIGCLLTLAVVLQVSVLAPMSLPGGGPALIVLVVAVLALSDGPTVGMLVGFAGGVLADLTPPSDHQLGQSVLVLVLVGELAGLCARPRPGFLRPVALVGLASMLAGLGIAGLGALLGQPIGAGASLVGDVAASTAFTVALTPAALLLVGGFGHRAGAPADRGPEFPARQRAGRVRRRNQLGRSAAAGGLR